MNEHPIHYVPTLEEIASRKSILSWMMRQEWNDKLIHEIMIHDNPKISTVKKLIDKHGPDKAYKKLLRYIK